MVRKARTRGDSVNSTSRSKLYDNDNSEVMITEQRKVTDMGKSTDSMSGVLDKMNQFKTFQNTSKNKVLDRKQIDQTLIEIADAIRDENYDDSDGI